LEISKSTVLGNSSLGIFALSTEKYSVVPLGTKESVIKTILETLNVKIVHSTIANSVLIGTLAVGNSKTLLVPLNTSGKEIKLLQDNLEEDVEIIEVNSKFTALGNLVVLNDKGAVISEMFEKKAQTQIRDILDVEVTVGNLLGSPLVGSMAMSTNKGALVHPLLSEEEVKELSSILKVRADVCTINRGVPYPRVGIIANSRGAVIGTDSTGPESMRIFEVLLAP